MTAGLRLAALMFALGGVLLYCEYQLRNAESDSISAHSARVSCLIDYSLKLPVCGPDSEDYDSCPAAVLACQKNGSYQLVQRADDELETRGQYARAARVAVFITAIVLVLWLAWRCITGWRRRLLGR